jgi:hypothetical protein
VYKPLRDINKLVRLHQDIVNLRLDLHNSEATRALTEDEVVALQMAREVQEDLDRANELWRAAWMKACIARLTRGEHK